VLLGSSGLLDKGSGGVYTSPVYEGVALRLISRDIAARDRGINGGHILPYLRLNYPSQIAKSKARGVWVDPVLRTPLPDLAREQRYKDNATKQAAYYAALKAEQEARGVLTQDRADDLAAWHGATPLVLAASPGGAQSFAYDQENGILTINQRLAELGKPIVATERGEMTVPEYKAWLQAKVEREKAQAQGEAKVAAEEAKPAEPAPQAA